MEEPEALSELTNMPQSQTEKILALKSHSVGGGVEQGVGAASGVPPGSARYEGASGGASSTGGNQNFAGSSVDQGDGGHLLQDAMHGQLHFDALGTKLKEGFATGAEDMKSGMKHAMTDMKKMFSGFGKKQ